jgi:hypothetical protein
LVLPKRIDNWSLTSLLQRLVKTGSRLIKHARYYWLLLAESQLTRRGCPDDGGQHCSFAGGDRVEAVVSEMKGKGAGPEGCAWNLPQTMGLAGFDILW